MKSKSLERLPGESYNVYKIRRKLNQLIIKEQLNGNIKRVKK